MRLKVVGLATMFLAFLAVAATPATAQYSVGTGVEYQSFDFGAGLGADGAALFMIPVAARIPLSAVEGLTFDIFSAWADRVPMTSLIVLFSLIVLALRVKSVGASNTLLTVMVNCFENVPLFPSLVSNRME